MVGWGELTEDAWSAIVPAVPGHSDERSFGHGIGSS